MELNSSIVSKVLEVVDRGLSKGLGTPSPGNMCVEAAVCFALGLPHGDDPKCVSRVVRALKISLNDSTWSTKTARAAGMRKLAVLQLGTSESFDDYEFIRLVIMYIINVTMADLLEDMGPMCKEHTLALRSAKTLAEGKIAVGLVALDSGYTIATTMRRIAQAIAYIAANADYVGTTYIATTTSYAAYAIQMSSHKAKVRDAALAKFAEGVCQILINMNVQGVQYLHLLK